MIKPTLKWVALTEALPTEEHGAFLLFSPSMYDDPDYPGHPVQVSNPEYIRRHGIEHGYSHWMGPVELPEGRPSWWDKSA